nr:hypothetical protein [uncultured Caulobacter sp.]
MPTRIHLAPNGPTDPATNVRRFNFNRPIAVGAALVLWAAILVGLKLLAI